MALKLWHCAGSRSIRPLWTLEEMGLDFELEVMKFPPRFVHAGYTDINPCDGWYAPLERARE